MDDHRLNTHSINVSSIHWILLICEDISTSNLVSDNLSTNLAILATITTSKGQVWAAKSSHGTRASAGSDAIGRLQSQRWRALLCRITHIQIGHTITLPRSTTSTHSIVAYKSLYCIQSSAMQVLSSCISIVLWRINFCARNDLGAYWILSKYGNYVYLCYQDHCLHCQYIG